MSGSSWPDGQCRLHKGGGQPDAVFDNDCALSIGDAVIPAHEGVAGIGNGAEHGGIADVVVTGTGHAAFAFNLDIDCGFKVGLEDGYCFKKCV